MIFLELKKRGVICILLLLLFKGLYFIGCFYLLRRILFFSFVDLEILCSIDLFGFFKSIIILFV